MTVKGFYAKRFSVRIRFFREIRVFEFRNYRFKSEGFWVFAIIGLADWKGPVLAP